MLGYLSTDIICSEARRGFRECNCELQETDDVQGQISEHIFVPNEGTVFIYLQYFLQHAHFWKLGNVWTIVAIWCENMLGYLSADIISSETRTVFRERSSTKTVSNEEQKLSKDISPSIFSPQMEAIVFIILQQGSYPFQKQISRTFLVLRLIFQGLKYSH